MQYASLCCVVPWKTWQDHINKSIVGAPRCKQSSRKRTPRLQAKQDGDALPLLRSSNGNVSCRGTGLYHHAYWQMVKQCISMLHKKASGAVLAARCEANAHVRVVGTLPDEYVRTHPLPQVPTKQSDPITGKHLSPYYRIPILITTLHSLIGPTIARDRIPQWSTH